MLDTKLDSKENFKNYSSDIGLKPELTNDGFEAFKERLGECIIAGGTYEDVFIDDEHVEWFVLNVKHKIQESNWMVRDIIQNYVDFCFKWFDGQNYRITEMLNLYLK